MNKISPNGLLLFLMLHSITRHSFKIRCFMSFVQWRFIFLFKTNSTCSVVMESIQYKFDSNRPRLLVLKRKKGFSLLKMTVVSGGRSPALVKFDPKLRPCIIYLIFVTLIKLSCIIPVLLKGTDCLNRY